MRDDKEDGVWSHRIHSRSASGPRWRGLAVVWAIFGTFVCVCFAVLAVDVGRYTLARSEAQAAADAAARYAVAGMIRSSTREATAYSQACVAIADESVDRRPLTLSTTDVEVGFWNESSRTFSPNASHPNANAVRVSVRARIGGSGSAPTFAAILSGKPADIVAQSVATATIISYEFTAPSSGNLWLAGAPDNTVINNLQNNANRNDSSGTSANPAERPLSVSLTDLGVAPGDTITMEGLSGSGNNGGQGASTYGPDGNLGRMVAQGDGAATVTPTTSTRGIANMRGPISSFIAVFLTDADPASTAAPAALDFGTAAARDYANIAPLNKQPFFIGDGKRDNSELQQIKVPPDATRIFFGMMDAWQWNDNTGSYTMSLYRGLKVKTVK